MNLSGSLRAIYITLMQSKPPDCWGQNTSQNGTQDEKTVNRKNHYIDYEELQRVGEFVNFKQFSQKYN